MAERSGGNNDGSDDNAENDNGNKHVLLVVLVALISSVVWALPIPSITASFGEMLSIVPAAITVLLAFSGFLAILAVTSMSGAPMFLIGAALLASSFVLIWFKGFSTAAIIAAAGFFLSMIIYSKSVRQESRERIRASPFKCSSTGYGGATFLFIAALTISVYLGAQGMTQFPIPQSAIDMAITPLLSMTGCSGSDTLDVCVETLTETQIAGLRESAIRMCKGNTACETLVDRQIASEKTSLVEQTKAKLAESLSINKTSKETLSALLGAKVRGKIDEMLAPYMKYIAPLVALTVFTTLSTVSMLVRFPVLVLSALCFAVFRAFGVITIYRENKEVEVIE